MVYRRGSRLASDAGANVMVCLERLLQAAQKPTRRTARRVLGEMQANDDAVLLNAKSFKRVYGRGATSWEVTGPESYGGEEGRYQMPVQFLF